MTNHSSRYQTALGLLGFLLVAACGTTVLTLDTKPAAPTEDVDLSGQWQLRDTGGARRRPESNEEVLIPTRAASRRQSSRTRPKGSSVHVFLEYGSALKVSQTPYSLFISYDRSVVEEYTFGENRMINVGPIEARRVSGWEGQSFVVETLDREGAILFETWSLNDAGVLQRDVRIVDDERETFRLKQVFDRS